MDLDILELKFLPSDFSLEEVNTSIENYYQYKQEKLRNILFELCYNNYIERSYNAKDLGIWLYQIEAKKNTRFEIEALIEVINKTRYINDINNYLKRIQRYSIMNDSPKFIALFFLLAEGLSAQRVSEILTSSCSYSQLVFKEYLNFFDLQDMQIDMALRFFLSRFQLPKESQTIYFVIECFVDRYVKSNGLDISLVDSVFSVAYALLILNTYISKVELPKCYKITKNKFRNMLSNTSNLSINLDLVYNRVYKKPFKINDQITRLEKYYSALETMYTDTSISELVSFISFPDVTFCQDLLLTDNVEVFYNNSNWKMKFDTKPFVKLVNNSSTESFELVDIISIKLISSKVTKNIYSHNKFSLNFYCSIHKTTHRCTNLHHYFQNRALPCKIKSFQKKINTKLQVDSIIVDETLSDIREAHILLSSNNDIKIIFPFTENLKNFLCYYLTTMQYTKYFKYTNKTSSMYKFKESIRDCNKKNQFNPDHEHLIDQTNTNEVKRLTNDGNLLIFNSYYTSLWINGLNPRYRFYGWSFLFENCGIHQNIEHFITLYQFLQSNDTSEKHSNIVQRSIQEVKSLQFKRYLQDLYCEEKDKLVQKITANKVLSKSSMDSVEELETKGSSIASLFILFNQVFIQSAKSCFKIASINNYNQEVSKIEYSSQKTTTFSKFKSLFKSNKGKKYREANQYEIVSQNNETLIDSNKLKSWNIFRKQDFNYIIFSFFENTINNSLLQINSKINFLPSMDCVLPAIYRQSVVEIVYFPTKLLLLNHKLFTRSFINAVYFAKLMDSSFFNKCLKRITWKNTKTSFNYGIQLFSNYRNKNCLRLCSLPQFQPHLHWYYLYMLKLDNCNDYDDKQLLYGMHLRMKKYSIIHLTNYLFLIKATSVFMHILLYEENLFAEKIYYCIKLPTISCYIAYTDLFKYKKIIFEVSYLIFIHVLSMIDQFNKYLIRIYFENIPRIYSIGYKQNNSKFVWLKHTNTTNPEIPYVFDIISINLKPIYNQSVKYFDFTELFTTTVELIIKIKSHYFDKIIFIPQEEYIIAFLLTLFNPEITFKFIIHMNSLIDRIKLLKLLSSSTYIPELSARDSLFENLCHYNVPLLIQHFKIIDLRLNYFFYDWLSSLFCKSCLPVKYIAWAFDLILLFGESAIFSIGLSILSLLQKKLLGLDYRGCLYILLNRTKVTHSFFEENNFKYLLNRYWITPKFFHEQLDAVLGHIKLENVF